MKRLLLAATAMLLGACPASQIEELAALQTGTFDSQGGDRLVDRRIRIDAPSLGDIVFYQQLNHRQELSVYRQRILVLYESAGGELVQAAYSLTDPERFVDATADSFRGLSEDALTRTMPEGCLQVFTPTENGYRSYVDPATCVVTSSRTGKLRRIEAESILTRDTLRLAERGYDADSGEQLFGTEPGGYLLLRRVATDDAQ